MIDFLDFLFWALVIIAAPFVLFVLVCVARFAYRRADEIFDNRKHKDH